MDSPQMRTRTRRLALGAILLFALVLRLWNLDWDQGTHQHPDERYWSFVAQDISAPDSVGQYFDAENSPLNPYQYHNSFVYGTAPLFITKMTGSFLLDGPQPAGAIVDGLDAVGVDLLREDGTPKFDAKYNVNLIGRVLSALIDTATVLLIYLLGRDLFGRRVGLLAALLQATTVLHIQYAHFFGAEPWAAFFVTAVMWGSVRLAKGDMRLRVGLLTGAALGLAVASKLNTGVIIIAPFLAVLIRGLPVLKSLFTGHAKPAQVWRPIRAGLLVVTTGALFFRVWQPYTFGGLFSVEERFSADIEYITDVNTGGGFPWIFQWIGTTPLTYPLESAFWWGLGPALSIAVAVGIGMALHRVVTQRRWDLLLPLSFLVAMLALVSQQFNPLIRYLLPAYPTATVLGAWALVQLWDTRHRFARAARILAAALVAATVLWALAFVNGVYGNTHPRIQATEWISQNVPDGSTVSEQAWDDALPLYLPDVVNPQIQTLQLDPFFPDRAIDQNSGLGKVDEHIDRLNRIDYVIEASNKFYDTLPQFPAKYPSTLAYYESLFDGSLGFEKVAEFSSPPSLFGVQINTSRAEETFTVYDQPTVTIWAKTDQFSVERARAILNPDQARVAVDLAPREASTNALLLSPDELEEIQQGGTFSDIFSTTGPIAAVPWLWWLLFLQIAAFAVLPWGTRLFRHLPDRGYGLSKVLGLVAVAIPVWLTVSWNAMNFGATVVWFWFVVLAAAGAIGWLRHGGEVARGFAERRLAWVVSEAIFLIAFFFVLWLRTKNPDLWEAYLGGEKPMELAYLTAIARTTELPAYDPWFAGGSMNYYYMGWFLVAVPMRALKIAPEVGFQLGLATFAAMTSSVAFSTAHNLVAFSRQAVARRQVAAETPGPVGQTTGRSAVLGGIAGVTLLMLMGNWAAIRQQIDRLQEVNTWGSGADQGGVAGAVGGLWAWITGAELNGGFDWWGPSRVNPGLIDITEFPYFSFLFGDLHPHLMGLVFVGLTVAFAVAYLASMQEGDTRRAFWLAGGLALATGLSRTTNTWDLPTVLLIGGFAIVLGAVVRPEPRTSDRHFPVAALVAALGLAVFVGDRSPGGGVLLTLASGLGVLAAIACLAGPTIRARLLGMTRDLAMLGVAHVLIFWPYLRSTETFSVGLDRAELYTPMEGFLTHHGTYLIVALAFVASSIVAAVRRMPNADNLPLYATILVVPALALMTFIASTPADAAAVAAALAYVMGALFVFQLITEEHHDLGQLIALGLYTVGFGIVAGVDVITVENDIDRMNTVFKFWLQGWQVLALASAYGIWHVGSVLTYRAPAVAPAPDVAMLDESAPADATDAVVAEDTPPVLVTHPPTARSHTLPWRVGWGVALTAITISGLAYPLLATGERLDRRFSYGVDANTLDGLAYLNENPTMPRLDQGPEGPETFVALADDLPLITWLRDNAQGTPTIVEWSGGTEFSGSIYEWNSRVAITTGLPTVLGWDWHQQQQRWGFQDMIFQRRNDIQDLYLRAATADDITRFVRAYDVSYIVVGVQEHRFGTEEALAQIALHPATVEVARNGPNALYWVDHAQLTSPQQ